MPEEKNRNSDCSPSKSGGRGTCRASRQRKAARESTRKRAGIITAREIVKHVSRPLYAIFILPALFKYLLKTYISVFTRCAACMMGVMGVFKWLRKDIVQRDRNRRSLTPKINVLNNEAYRNALQAFIDRRRSSNESVGCFISPNSPDKERLDFFIKTSNENEKKKRNDEREKVGIAGVPNVEASEIFEIGWIAGTEDRYMELMFAEWQSTRVSLRRHTHPDCRDAVKADLEVLTEIRHPNVLLLMATTHTDDHGLVAIFEPVDCTLYNFVHEQGERVSVQGIAKCAGNLAGALKHAHTRGYVHGAISSHCIFLATCGTVKLGGWELASSLNGPKGIRQYDQRLRYEIYRWQAPEIFKGQEASRATDVYGLALLIWEMCTMNIPWNGLSKPEVEIQYVRWEQGVVTDLYNFPPLLSKLLDAGLQLEVSKRTLDMSRMRRFLQTLEIQYEDAKPIYVEASTNNNNNPPKLVLKATPECNLTNDSSPIQKYTPAQTPKRYSERKASESKSHVPRTLNLNLAEEPDKWEPRERLSFSQNETAPVEIFQQVVKPTSVRKVNARNVNQACPSEKSSKVAKHKPKITETQRKPPRRVIPADVNLTQTLDSTDDESSCNDLRTDIRKLRQALATKRKYFFYGSDSSQLSQTENETKIEDPKSTIITQVRSKDYEPHKPASHKTSFEPKQAKTSGQYNSSPPKTNTYKIQKSPYSYVPTAIRDAVVQPKVLNSDSQSFFESSLWRKEKMICISKMRKSDIDDSTFCISRLARPKETEKIETIDSDETYTIDPKADATVETNNPINHDDNLSDATTSTFPRSRSLRALKDSLDRATEIILSTPTQDESTIVSSPPKSPENFDPNNSSLLESVFEDLYELKNEGSDVEIKSIERTDEGETVFFSTENTPNVKANDPPEIIERPVRRRSVPRDEIKRGSFDISRLSGVVCESIAESENEHHENELSSSDSKTDEKTVVSLRTRPNPEIIVSEKTATFELCDNEKDCEKPEEPETSYALMIFNDKDRECHSCNPKSNLARRRSLPAALGQLRNLSNVSLGKLPIRKGGVSDNTVEDIYIDDEFGDSLNVNMVLLYGDVTTDDEDFLPHLELSDSQDYP